VAKSSQKQPSLSTNNAAQASTLEGTQSALAAAVGIDVRPQGIEVGGAARAMEPDVCGGGFPPRGDDWDGGVAIGANAQVRAGAVNSVAIGANSIATEPNTVSFGTGGAERRLTNVAPGVAFSDAATFGQLQIGLGVVGKRITTANSGVAMSMAMSAVPLSLRRGEQGVSGGVAAFEGRSALGLRYQGQPTDGVTIGVSLGFSEGAKTAASAGVGFKW
jgi:hypothetical protein